MAFTPRTTYISQVQTCIAMLPKKQLRYCDQNWLYTQAIAIIEEQNLTYCFLSSAPLKGQTMRNLSNTQQPVAVLPISHTPSKTPPTHKHIRRTVSVQRTSHLPSLLSHSANSHHFLVDTACSYMYQLPPKSHQLTLQSIFRRQAFACWSILLLPFLQPAFSFPHFHPTFCAWNSL